MQRWFGLARPAKKRRLVMVIKSGKDPSKACYMLYNALGDVRLVPDMMERSKDDERKNAWQIKLDCDSELAKRLSMAFPEDGPGNTWIKWGELCGYFEGIWLKE